MDPAELLSPDVALERLLAAVPTLPVVEVDLAGAEGRTLAEPVCADRDFPPTDRSAMDGFAVRAADLQEPGTTLHVVGEVRAGAPATAEALGPRQAVRIYTGAVVPAGADAVVMVEQTTTDGDRVSVREVATVGQHVRPRAQDRSRGDELLAVGRTIGPAEIAALASVGHARVRVRRRPRAAVLSTGDEVIEPDRTPADHQVRNSNAPMLMAQLREAGAEATYLGVAPDGVEPLRACFEQARRFDLLLITGGVSVGDYDLVGRALAESGMELLFHRIALKPGKPILAGTLGEAVVLGLPGNPVSSFVGFRLFAVPALRGMQGAAITADAEMLAELETELRCRPGRRTYHLGHLRAGEGRWFVRPVRSTGSGDVLSLAGANAFVVTEADRQGAIESGATVRVLPWPAFHLRPRD